MVFFQINTAEESFSRENCQRVLVDLVYYFVVQVFVWY